MVIFKALAIHWFINSLYLAHITLHWLY